MQIGDHNVTYNVTSSQAREILPPSHTIDAPPGIHNLPSPATGPFVGRENELSELANLRASDEVIGQVIHGLGGVGKSELALRYAHAHCPAYRLLWWINAASAEQIAIGLADLTRRLHSPAPLAYAREWAVGWLQSHSGWLLILDNVEHLQDITDLLGQLGGHGRVLVTTRRDVGSARWTMCGLAPLRLPLLSRAAGADLLGQLTGRPDERQEAAELAQELGDLPLALEQAGSYISQRRITIAAYRQRLAEEPARIHAAVPEGSSPDRVVARIWAVTMETVSEQSHLAHHIMYMMAYLSSDPLAVDVLAPLETQGFKIHDVEDALSALASYSMIEYTGTHVRVHPLVQSVTREWLRDIDRTTHKKSSPCQCVRHRQIAMELLCTALPPDPRTNVSGWPRWNELLPHVIALGTNMRGDIYDFGYLLNLAGTYLQGQGQFAKAVQIFEKALADCERIGGEGNAASFYLQNNLAGAYADAERLEDAIKILESLIPQRIRAKDKNDRGALTSQSNLGNVYTEVGRPDKAIKLLEPTFTRQREILGDDDPATLSTRHNLAAAYRASGRPQDAVTLFEAVLADSRRVLGDEDPRTLSTRHGLASAYGDLGQRTEAAKLSAAVAEDLSQVLGPDHPHTLRSHLTSALARRKAGTSDEAIPELEALCDKHEQTLGSDHPRTLAARNHLADAYQSAARLTEAIALFEAILTDRQRVLGPEHPDVLISRHNVAAAYADAGRLDEAITLLEALLPDEDRLLSPGNPDAQGTRFSLAVIYCKAGRLPEGIALFTATLEQARGLEPKNPMPLTMANNLAVSYLETSSPSEAIPLFEALTATYAEYPDRNVRERLATRDNLAVAYLRVGRIDEAMHLLEATLEEWVGLAGPFHRDTLTCRNNLAHAYLEDGRIDQAIATLQDLLRGCDETFGPEHPLTHGTRELLTNLRDRA